jgi:hypothetical protein
LRTTSCEKSAAVRSGVGSAICQRWPPCSVWPSGRQALAWAMAWRTSSSDMPRCDSASGFACTRTAGSDEPSTVTSPTPTICASFCASTVEALSYSADDGSRGEESASAMMGACEGLTLT